MSYEVKQGNIFGRIGSGFGEGLSGQLPKEMERSRLAQSLEKIGQQQDASPFQQFSALVSAPGTNPQIIQSGTDLLRQQAMMQGYRRANQQYRDQGTDQQQSPQQPGLDQVVFGQKPGQQQRPSVAKEMNQAQQIIPQQTQGREEQAKSNPPAASDNPLNPKYVPPPAWNQKMQDRAINEAFDTGKATNLDDAMKYADQQQRYYTNAAPAEQAQYEYKRGIDQEVDNLFDKELQKRLQKEGKETFNDISGDLQLDLQKQAKNSVATGRMTPQAAAEYYSKAALDLGKQKTKYKELANPPFNQYITPSKKEDRVKSLVTMGHEYAKYGNAAQEDYYNQLVDSKEGIGLSPGGAAIIAYPRSPEIKSTINDAKIRGGDLQHTNQQAVRVADDVLNTMKPNDSLLAIVRELYTKYPSFNERAFFDYMNENRERWPNNPNFAREMETGISNVMPNWADMWLFPVYGLSPAHK